MQISTFENEPSKERIQDKSSSGLKFKVTDFNNKVENLTTNFQPSNDWDG